MNKIFIDEEIIQNMKELGNGDNEFSNRLLIVQLMTIYLDNLPERRNEIESAIKNKNAKNIEFSAHTLKSSSKLIGLTALAEDCQILEDLGASQNLQNCHEVFLRIQDATEKAFTVLKDKIIELETN